MQALDDQRAFEWIRSARARLDLPNRPKPSSPDWPGIFVSDLMPSEFEAFAKVLHRFDASYKEIDTPLSPSEKTVLKIPDCEPLWSLIGSRRSTSPTTRITWKELAALLNVPYIPEINFNWFRQKIDGWCLSQLLDSPGAWPVGEECDELCSMLKGYSGTKESFFRISDHMMYSFPDKRQLFIGSLEDAIPFLKAQRGTWFEYWWPADHQWCLCYDDEVGVTIVGGSRKLISTLSTSLVLECIEVKPMTRVDDRASMPEIVR
jgi:hypothetical protein